jgi:hypothetical protein
MALMYSSLLSIFAIVGATGFNNLFGAPEQVHFIPEGKARFASHIPPCLIRAAG